MFSEDLNCVLSGMALPPRVPFKAWADSNYALRRSPAATAAVAHLTNYLRPLYKKQHALWPRSTPTLITAPEREFVDGHVLTFPAPGIISLCRKHLEITTPAVIKAATALLIMHHTKHTHALFSHLEAQRARFPFVPSSVSLLGDFDAADVAGPTISGVIDLLALRPDETVLQFIRRVQDEQTQLTQFAGVPWHEVVSQLGSSVEDVLLQATDTFIFNWMPGLSAKAGGRNPHSHIKVEQIHIRTRLGMVFSVEMGGSDGSQVVMLLHGSLSNMSTNGITSVGEEVRRIILWLVESESWDLPVEDFKKIFKDSE